MVFLTAFLIDIFGFVIYRNAQPEANDASTEPENQEDDSTGFIVDIVLKSICMIYIIRVLIYEAKSMMNEGFASYYSQFFNYGDSALIMTFTATSILDVLNVMPESIAIFYSIVLL